MSERWYEGVEAGRRWVLGGGGPVPGGGERLVVKARGGKKKRWASAGRAVGRGRDQIDAERVLWALVDAGLVRVRQRRTPRGDWEAFQWALTEVGERQAALWSARATAVDVAGYLAGIDPPGHELLERIRAWLEGEPDADDPTALALVLALGETLRRGQVPRGRLLSVEIGGHTKAVRVEAHRAVLERVCDAPLEEVVRLHGVAVLAHGPFRFRIAGRVVDGAWSVPWLALTQETLAEMSALQLLGGATRLLTVENLVPFEEVVRAGLPEGTVAVFAAGFPAGLVRDFLLRLCALGITHVDHWGDMDLGGLRILRHLDEILPVPVRPFRMEPALLDVLPTLPLTPRDREGLAAWVTDEQAPARDVAAALLARGAKAEQEGWLFLDRAD